MPVDQPSVNVRLLRFDQLSADLQLLLEKENGGMIEYCGELFFLTGEYVLKCDNTPHGKTLFNSICSGSVPDRRSLYQDPWKSLLNGTVLPEKAGIRDDAQRQVIVFASHTDQEKPLHLPLFTDLIPIEKSDALTEPEDGYIALIRSSGLNAEEENTEFAAAAVETVLGETGTRICAGIGNKADMLASIPLSYSQAKSALRTGIRYNPDESVYIYRRQILERLIDSVPTHLRSSLKGEIITPEAGRILTDEMLETIRVYFRNDLNLSTAARQLFIHRNTLLYRLEKIRRETGLDLRNFRDAAAFQVISLLPDESREPNTFPEERKLK